MLINEVITEGRNNDVPVYYFAYGMLTDPEIMGDAELVGVGELKNFEYEMFAYANVTPAAGHEVYGCLWAIDRRAIANLDHIEGYPSMYDRRTVLVYVDGKKYPAEVYLMTPETKQHMSGSQPTQSYVNRIVRGYRNAGVPIFQLKRALNVSGIAEPGRKIANDPSPWADSDSQINESLSQVAYHYTNIGSAQKILKSGQFELSSSPGSIEQQYAPAGKPYFLSTTRTRLGDYHRSRGSTYGVIFALNGDWFNQHYKSAPVDYWQNRNPTGQSHRGHEAEDRVFSAEPTIPIDGVTAIHVLANRDSAMPTYNAVVRDILISAKARGITAYFYSDPVPWMNLDTRKQGDVSMLKGQAPVNTHFTRRGKLQPHYLTHWIELMMKTDQSQLSKNADQMRYSLAYTYDKQDAIRALGVDFANARKPDSGPERGAIIKILDYMRQHRLNTIEDFVNNIAAKWAVNKKNS